MFELVELKEICNISSGGTPSRKKNSYYGGNIKWAKISDLETAGDGFIYDTEEKITNAGLENIRNRIFEIDTLFLAMYGSVGKTAITKARMSCNQAILGITAKNDNSLDLGFLKYWFDSTKEKLLDSARGVALKNLSAGIVKDLKIPLPPLKTQKQIAQILDDAAALRDKTRQLLTEYDLLAQSIFLDMFGDPVINQKGWKKRKGLNYYDVKGRVGWKGYKKTDLREEGPIVLGATHIDKFGNIDITKSVHLTREKFLESPEIFIEKNDLIFVQRGNTIGKVGIVNFEIGEATINPVVLILRAIGDNNPYFLLHLMMNENLKKEVIDLNSGSAQPMITQKSIKEYNIIDVPTKLQNYFAEKIALIEQQKELAKQELKESEDLFNCLLQKAFKGELV